jgi:hypothetical protein
MWMLAGDEVDGWVQWVPTIAKSANWSLSEAIEAFEPLEYEAGSACARWLKESALLQWPQTVTWVLFRNGLVEGFFAMRSGIVELDLPKTGPGDSADAIIRPCSVVEWLCRRRGDEFDGRPLINQAIYRAREVGKTQGNIALVIEPFNATIGKILLAEHDYLSETAQGHLWLPLYEPNDLLMPG